MDDDFKYSMALVYQFLLSSQFWYYHGVVLSGLWIFVSAMAILAKNVSTQIHMLLFIFIDFTTLFFAGIALFRVYPQISNFMSWSFIKQIHVTAGFTFLIIMIYQHILGVKTYIQKTKSPRHRWLGKYVVSFGRAMAALGWVLAGDIQSAIFVAMASIPIFIISLMTPQQKPPIKKQQQKKDQSKIQKKNKKKL